MAIPRILCLALLAMVISGCTTAPGIFGSAAQHARQGRACHDRSTWSGTILAGAGADTPVRGPVFVGGFDPPKKFMVEGNASHLQVTMTWNTTAPQDVFLAVDSPSGIHTVNQTTPIAGGPLTLSLDNPPVGNWDAGAFVEGAAAQVSYTIAYDVTYTVCPPDATG